MEKVECPYCKEYVEIETSDHHNGYEEYECPNCEKHFEVYAETNIYYSVVGKADCLNGGEHEWKQQFGVPRFHFKGKYICNNCSATKTVQEELTTKEEIEEYFADMKKEK